MIYASFGDFIIPRIMANAKIYIRGTGDRLCNQVAVGLAVFRSTRLGSPNFEINPLFQRAVFYSLIYDLQHLGTQRSTFVAVNEIRLWICRQ